MTSILAVRLDSDGDVLLTGPALRALAAGADDLTLLCGPRGVRAAELLPGVDRLLVHRAAWIDPEPPPVDRAETLALVERIAGLRVDQAVVFTSFHQSPLPTALLLRLAGVPTIAAISEDYPGSLLDVRHRGLPDDLHEVERALSLVATLGHALPPGDTGGLAVQAPPGRALALTDPYIVVHPGTSVPARAWSPRRHAELVDALVAEGWPVVVTGGPDEVGLTAEVAGPPGRVRVHDLGGRTSLGALAGVLRDAAAVVVGNTGPAHLAAAVGTPVVSLFAPTVPVHRWRPYGVPTRLLYAEVPCAGCRAKLCPVSGHPCLDGDRPGQGVAVAQVLAALGELLAGDVRGTALVDAHQRSR